MLGVNFAVLHCVLYGDMVCALNVIYICVVVIIKGTLKEKDILNVNTDLYALLWDIRNKIFDICRVSHPQWLLF